MNRWAAAAEAGYAVLSTREVRCRAHHECTECGRSIERNEQALRTVVIDGLSVRSEYRCILHPWR